MERKADAAAHGFTLAEPPRFAALRAFCAVSEGADVVMPVSPIPSAVCDSAKCIAAVLGDAQRRLGIFGAREGMPWSLGSVFGCLVARFVSGLCGMKGRVIETPGVRSQHNGIAVSRDGATLLVSDTNGGTHRLHVFNVHTGARLRTIGSWGTGPLQFRCPRQVWVASDDYVFVADEGNDRIQILTPVAFDFYAFVGVGQLGMPRGVCADGDIIAVSELCPYRISVFSRCDGALLRRFGSKGSGDGQLYSPGGLCFLTENRLIAVADCVNDRISVFSVEGEFVRHVGVGELCFPMGVACSAFDELVVVDVWYERVAVFSASGEVLHTMGRSIFTGVAVHSGAIFAQTDRDDKCVVYM
jgi:DNA-binding beta-propeller fold protein YncE